MADISCSIYDLLASNKHPANLSSISDMKSFKKFRLRSSQSEPRTVLSAQIAEKPIQDTKTAPIISTSPSSQLQPPAPVSDISAQNSESQVPSMLVPTFDQPQGESSAGWSGLKLSLRTLKASASFIPPLAASAGVLIQLTETMNGISANQETLQTMADQINRLAQVVHAYGASPVPRHVQDTIDNLVQNMEGHMAFIQSRMNRTRLMRVVNAVDDEKAIMNSLRDLSSAIELFQIGTTVNIETQGRQISSITKDMFELELLKKLDAADDARYDANSRAGCMAGTRVQTLSQLSDWASDPHSPTILWLNGMAGVGKSAIACSFCQMADNNGYLGASFFSSQSSESTNSVHRILPTIAYQLAYRLPAYREALCDVLRQTPRSSYAFAPIQEQGRHFFFNLKDKLETGHHLVVVIDALDECADPFAVDDLLRVMLHSNLPFRLLIASRPASHVNRFFSTQTLPNKTHSKAAQSYLKPSEYASLRLHDTEIENIEEDITRYLSHKLLPTLLEIGEEYATTTIESLARKSKNWFLFASNAAHYISPHTNSDMPRKEVIERVSILLQPPPNSYDPDSTKIIDGFYGRIFASAYSNIRESQQKSLRSALDTVLCFHEPQSILTIAMLLEEDTDVVRAHLENFSSVLGIPYQNDRPILVFHTSFFDYVRDRRRSGTYALDCDYQHRCIALACLKLMNNLLRENICGINRKETPNANIDESVIRERISPALRYACTHWTSHLVGESGATNADSVAAELKIFVFTHLLHWLECLSLLRRLDVAFDSVERAYSYIKALRTNDFETIRAILLDAQFTIPHVYHFIQLHALEVYVSVLVWLPIESQLKEKYWQKQAPRVVLGLGRTWSNYLDASHSTRDVTCLTFSSGDGLFACTIASTVQIWNLGTKSVTLANHKDYVTSLTFSTDGSLLASGSDDKGVRIWDSQTGRLALRLLGHTDTITSLAFSPDQGKLASASDDKTVRIWNVSTGELIKELSSHTAYVTSITFLPNGSELVSVSLDKNVRVWNADTGQLIDDLPGCLHSATMIILSPNGSKLASKSDDGTLMVWHAKTNDLITKLSGHVETVAFSPNGTTLASSHGDTVRIWDAGTGELNKELSIGAVASITFSTDGSKLACGLRDETVQVWNIRTGEIVAELSNLTRQVTATIFSSDGTKLTSMTNFGAVHVWNAETGEQIQESYAHSIITDPEGPKPIFWSIDEPATGQCRIVSLKPAGEELSQLWIWGPCAQRSISTSSSIQNKACIGYETGEIVILEMSAN